MSPLRSHERGLALALSEAASTVDYFSFLVSSGRLEDSARPLNQRPLRALRRNNFGIGIKIARVAGPLC